MNSLELIEKIKISLNNLTDLVKLSYCAEWLNFCYQSLKESLMRLNKTEELFKINWKEEA